MILRRQLPAYSPLTARAIAGAAGDMVLSKADLLQRAEAFIAARFHADRVLLTGSGCSALQLAIGLATRERRVDAVALPAFQCYEVASAAVGAGARIAWYDIDPRTLAPDAQSLDDALKRAAVAVIAPFYGVPVDWEACVAIAHRHDALLIEDAAQGQGATWRGLPLGAHGIVSVLSFGRGKGWTAGGGGALLVRGQERLAARVAALRSELERASPARDARTAAVALAQWLVGRPALYRFPSLLPGLHLGETIYHPPRAPTGISTFSAALLMRTHDLSIAEAAARTAQVDAWLRELPETLGARVPRSPPEGVAGYSRLPLVLEAAPLPHDWIRLRWAGMMPSYPERLCDLPQVRAHRADDRTRFPGAATLAARLVTLPTHSLVDDHDRDLVARFLRSR